MSIHHIILHAAKEVVESVNRGAEEKLPHKIVDIIKLHSALAVGSSFIPIPGADLAAAAANIWTMYIRINEELGISFKENILKSIATGVATNLGASFVVGLVAGSILKFIPGLGSIGGAVVIGTTIYAVTVASGVIYCLAVSAAAKAEQGAISESKLREEIDQILSDKSFVTQIVEEGKNLYREEKSKGNVK